MSSSPLPVFKTSSLAKLKIGKLTLFLPHHHIVNWPVKVKTTAQIMTLQSVYCGQALFHLHSEPVSRHCSPFLRTRCPKATMSGSRAARRRDWGAAAVTRHHGRSSCGFSPNAALWPVTYSMEMGETLGRPQNWLLRSQLQDAHRQHCCSTDPKTSPGSRWGTRTCWLT